MLFIGSKLIDFLHFLMYVDSKKAATAWISLFLLLEIDKNMRR